MSSGARLLSLRLQGFKSFAERTRVEFVPGVNAVVGPNGSGKSNLADAIRWALGEQGRALRSRKSEDVVFAGSERRSAVGMADVALVLDNADGLLPLDFAVVELGRRLYRSGENDYLLNRQRVRLRDLVELLDAAHLADNAFLFIGQGMVDQALALRPDERRPLFEEVAGVRRHERRRARAEAQLVEAEANLARVEDILAELRPQARRLAAQAAQQATREEAAADLAEGLLVSVGARWHDAAARAATSERALAAARSAVTGALDALREAEGSAAAAARALGGGAADAAARRAELEAVRSDLATLQLAAARASAQVEAARRDRTRLAQEHEAAEAERAGWRREAARPIPRPASSLDDELAEVETAIAEGRAELAGLRSARRAEGEARAAEMRAAAARAAEREALARRLAEVDRRVAEASAAAERSTEAAGRARTTAAAAASALLEARQAESDARARARAAREAATVGEAEHAAVASAAAAAAGRAAALRGRLEALRSRLAEDEARGIGRAARRIGGVALAAGLDVDPGLRSAVTGALGELARGYVVARGPIARLEGERGHLILTDAHGPGAAPPAPAEVARVRELVASVGGGLLVDAIRADPTGGGRRLLARAAWVPSWGHAVELAGSLPVGWVIAARDGVVAGAAGWVRLGGGETALERRAEAADVERELAAADGDAAATVDRHERVRERVGAAADVLEGARRAEIEATSAARAAEEAERRTAREAEAGAREAAWQAGRLEALQAERAGLAGRLDAFTAERPAAKGSAGSDSVPAAGPPAAAEAHPATAAVAAWEDRLAGLLGRRDRLAAARAAADAERRAAEAARARAEAGAALAEERLLRADAEVAALVERERSLEAEAAARGPLLAAASRREADAQAALEAAMSADAAARDRLRAAEGAAGRAREALRRAEEGLRAAEIGDLEARLALDALREGALVELAALGPIGLTALERLADGEPSATDGTPGTIALAEATALSDGTSPYPTSRAGDRAGEDEEAGDQEAIHLAVALARAGRRWATRPPEGSPPTAARLGSLRRRLHEMGAANPYAVEEHLALRDRLADLEAQHRDLVAAIERTRSLVVELNALVARRFRTTFEALEAAFDRRFRQLFGGGFARLSLTEPGDLATTGVDIVARPPGKKAQPLATLSGGERALTAVALLFAMLEVRPVPFCVLDEVDAALDEANIGRFVEGLRGLAEQTQFIVITHNRGTIEAADALYGVTLDDDAVSRVVSLRLEDAVAIAAAVSGEEHDLGADGSPPGVEPAPGPA